jgi:NAD kinase
VALAARAILVYRRSEYSELLARHATYGQAEFFLRSRGRSIDDVKARHEVLERAVHTVSAALPPDVRQTQLERSDLDRYQFAPEDIVLVIGQDGLVANVAKYLTGQPVIGLNPEPDRNPGVLVPHPVRAAKDLLTATVAKHAVVESRAMVRARLDDGQTLDALNDLYIGDQGHQSSRYILTVPGTAPEAQSSSGIIVGTGTGSTGWSRSIASDRNLWNELPPVDSRYLAWFVREAWPSPSTGATLTTGVLREDQALALTVSSDQLVVFGDGMDHDYLQASWGQQVEIAVSPRSLALVVGR